MNYSLKWFYLLGALFCLLILHFVVGEIPISFKELLLTIQGDQPDELIRNVILEFRIPRMAMCVIAGAGLAVSGLLMQTAFQNPLAGPYVLGINSGAGLFVALTLLTGFQFWTLDLGIVGSAILGSGVFAFFIVIFAKYLKNNLSLLLVGIMLGSFTSALVFVLQSLSDAADLKRLTFWAFGSVQHTSLNQLPLIILLFITGIGYAFLLIKTLNTFVLGQSHAQRLGVNSKRGMFHLIAATVILTGLITAYCGPISFIGLAVPNLVRILYKTQNHRVLLPACIIVGASFLLFCDILVQYWSSVFVLPINALTSLLGAPVVVYLIVKRLA